ncbi:hypothetical protein PLESTB_000577000 [Pleodorina starrii]|uniref:Translation initiation factor 3 C-terminal domain-containing protein n=1 Tax=Pleodorina starrii TaxID=330485 RepID=A0A9W6F1D5_9CHLO|nr:hypothetical protein PLESTM_000307900 [Pleodorina starrii]GLC52051.1 hypothetical protein PLESTB_000577000 [Pleodorina starrii]GLC72192.1 hypothetical protein PLESTF_001216900 [Pleodorina starrii]
MVLQASLLPGRPPASMLSAALWHVAKTELGGWAAFGASASSGLRGALTSPAPPEPPSVCRPPQIHPPHVQSHALLRFLHLPAHAWTPPVSPPATAGAPRPCQVPLSHSAAPSPRPWHSALHQYATSASRQSSIPTSAHGKRPFQDAESGDAADRARAAGSPGGSPGGKAAGSPGPSPGGKTGGSSGGSSGGGGKGGSRSKADPVKEMHLKPRITEHDLGYKLRQMEGWLADGIRAKLVVEFRSADPSQSEAAAALADSVVTRLAGKGQPLGPRQQRGDAWHLILRPLTPKQQPKQQQQQQQQPKEAEGGREAATAAGAAGGGGATATAA